MRSTWGPAGSAQCSSRTSVGRRMTTGPGRPSIAIAKLRVTRSGVRSGSRTSNHLFGEATEHRTEIDLRERVAAALPARDRADRPPSGWVPAARCARPCSHGSPAGRVSRRTRAADRGPCQWPAPCGRHPPRADTWPVAAGRRRRRAARAPRDSFQSHGERARDLMVQQAVTTAGRPAPTHHRRCKAAVRRGGWGNRPPIVRAAPDPQCRRPQSPVSGPHQPGR